LCDSNHAAGSCVVGLTFSERPKSGPRGFAVEKCLEDLRVSPAHYRAAVQSTTEPRSCLLCFRAVSYSNCIRTNPVQYGNRSSECGVAHMEILKALIRRGSSRMTLLARDVVESTISWAARRRGGEVNNKVARGFVREVNSALEVAKPFLV
jgi:hypothetical protein